MRVPVGLSAAPTSFAPMQKPHRQSGIWDPQKSASFSASEIIAVVFGMEQ